MNALLAQTPLHAWHAQHGGRMVDFAGWSMPVQYRSIVAEHQAVRTVAGLFDVSHMGRLRFSGPGAAGLLDSVVTRDVSRLTPGRVAYALVTRDDGGILDDVLVTHLRDAAGESYYLLVVNASNREKIVDWIQTRGRATSSVNWSDETTAWGMIALQGPRSAEFLQPLVDQPLAELSNYHAVETRIDGCGGILSRTGYTGEDGFELIVGSAVTTPLWERLHTAISEVGGMACGLGCRDTLRLEAGMPLYGHELSETINPFQAGLASAVRLDKADYPGREALRALKAKPPRSVRVGLLLDGKRVPREGFSVKAGERVVGQVSSGTSSPTLEASIAMVYVEPEIAAVGTQLSVDIRGQDAVARIVELPFYRHTANQHTANQHSGLKGSQA